MFFLPPPALPPVTGSVKVHLSDVVTARCFAVRKKTLRGPTSCSFLPDYKYDFRFYSVRVSIDSVDILEDASI
jgi:hypothetical protein